MSLRGQSGDWIQRAVSGGPWGKDRQQAEPVGNLGTLRNAKEGTVLGPTGNRWPREAGEQK